MGSERSGWWESFCCSCRRFFAFKPTFTNAPDIQEQLEATTGLIMHGLDLLGRYTFDLLEVTAMFGLWCVGVAVLLGEGAVEAWIPIKGKLFGMLGTFVLMVSFLPRTTERYFVLTVPLLILLLHANFRRRTWLWMWLVLQIFLSAAFSYWQVELKSFEGWSMSEISTAERPPAGGVSFSNRSPAA